MHLKEFFQLLVFYKGIWFDSVWSIFFSSCNVSNRHSGWTHRNCSTKDLTQFAAEAIAFNRQLSQQEEEQEDFGIVVCSMRLSPPSNSRLARRRAQSQALRTNTWCLPTPQVLQWCMYSASHYNHSYTYVLWQTEWVLEQTVKHSNPDKHMYMQCYQLLEQTNLMYTNQSFFLCNVSFGCFRHQKLFSFSFFFIFITKYLWLVVLTVRYKRGARLWGN